MEIVKTELLDAKKKFGDKRRTEIVADSSDFAIEDMIPNERMVLTLTRRGYMKRINANVYHTQNKAAAVSREWGRKTKTPLTTCSIRRRGIRSCSLPTLAASIA